MKRSRDGVVDAGAAVPVAAEPPRQAVQYDTRAIQENTMLRLQQGAQRAFAASAVAAAAAAAAASSSAVAASASPAAAPLSFAAFSAQHQQQYARESHALGGAAAEGADDARAHDIDDDDDVADEDYVDGMRDDDGDGDDADAAYGGGGDVANALGSGYVAGGGANSNTNSNSGLPASGDMLPCHVCGRSAPVESTCSFCTQTCCAYCARQCTECSFMYCPFCSVVNYELRYERFFCLDCHHDAAERGEGSGSSTEQTVSRMSVSGHARGGGLGASVVVGPTSFAGAFAQQT